MSLGIGEGPHRAHRKEGRCQPCKAEAERPAHQHEPHGNPDPGGETSRVPGGYGPEVGKPDRIDGPAFPEGGEERSHEQGGGSRSHHESDGGKGSEEECGADAADRGGLPGAEPERGRSNG